MIRINQKRLQEFLEFRRWKKTDLAKSLRYSESYITRLLKEDREPSAEFMERLHNISGLSLDELFFCSSTAKNGRN